ncbi:MAG: hypothetical protein Q8882_08780, partial [Bacillota bacterium]|nr:hypothetical protein [Bacillota bacterium]
QKPNNNHTLGAFFSETFYRLPLTPLYYVNMKKRLQIENSMLTYSFFYNYQSEMMRRFLRTFSTLKGGGQRAALTPAPGGQHGKVEKMKGSH